MKQNSRITYSILNTLPDTLFPQNRGGGGGGVRMKQNSRITYSILNTLPDTLFPQNRGGENETEF